MKPALHPTAQMWRYVMPVSLDGVYRAAGNELPAHRDPRVVGGQCAGRQHRRQQHGAGDGNTLHTAGGGTVGVIPGGPFGRAIR